VYLQAGRPIPPGEAYEGFAIAEDGVGLVRRFEDDFARAARRARVATRRRVTLVTGELYAPRLARLLDGLTVRGPRPRVVPIKNELFGGTVSVAGLLTGQDIQRGLVASGESCDVLLVPAVALRDGDGVFLDDMTPDDLADALATPVRAVGTTPRELLRALSAR